MVQKFSSINKSFFNSNKICYPLTIIIVLDRRWRGVRAVSKKTALPTNQPTNQPTNYYQQHWFYRTWLTPVQLNFEKHVSTICKKTNNQLNAISRIGVVLKQKEKKFEKILLYIPTLSTALLYGTLQPAKGLKKYKKFKKEVSYLYWMIMIKNYIFNY